MNVHALTRSYKGISNAILSPIDIYNTASNSKVSTNGIWDTGATNSVVTKTLAKKLGLTPTGQTRVKGVHGHKDGINVYAVKIVLNNQNVSFVLPVTECEQLTDDDSAEMLIGMDVITKGDFAITNFQGNTIMSFRIPSVSKIDFVEGIKSHTPKVTDKIPGRNDPCFCGSKKKYKHCHGK